MLVVVCCQGGDCLSLHEFETGDSVGTVPTGDHPVHLAVVENNVFVATMDERSVTSIDTDGAVSTIPTGVLGPSHFAVASGRLFVACTGGDAVAAIDPTALEYIGRVAVGREPHELVAADGQVFAGSRRDGTVSVIDPDAMTAERSISIDSDASVEDLEAAPDSDRVYALDERGGRIVALTRTGRVATADFDGELAGIDVWADRVFALERERGVVYVLDRALEPIAEHAVGQAPVATTTATGECWVVHRGDRTVRSLSGDCFELPHPARAMSCVTDSKCLISHYFDDAISLIDVDRKTVDWTAETGANPLGIAVI